MSHELRCIGDGHWDVVTKMAEKFLCVYLRGSKSLQASRLPLTPLLGVPIVDLFVGCRTSPQLGAGSLALEGLADGCDKVDREDAWGMSGGKPLNEFVVSESGEEDVEAPNERVGSSEML